MDKESAKKIVGVGGMKCSCCIPNGMTTKEVKRVLNRRARRRAKSELRSGDAESLFTSSAR